MGDFEGGQQLSAPTTSRQGQLARGDGILRGQEEELRVVRTRQQLDSKRVRAGQSSGALPLPKDAAPGPGKGLVSWGDSCIPPETQSAGCDSQQQTLAPCVSKCQGAHEEFM